MTDSPGTDDPKGSLAAAPLRPLAGSPERDSIDTDGAPGKAGRFLPLLFDQALDAMVAMDASGCIIDWNHQAVSLFGWTREEVLGQRLAATIIPPRYRESHERGLQHFLKTGEGPVLNQRIELSALRRDGQEFPVELTVMAAQEDGQHVFTAVLRDISSRKRYESQLARRALEAELLYRASVLAAEAGSFHEALQGCVDIVCQLTGWPVGHVYLPDDAQQRLIPSGIWHLESRLHEKFREATQRIYMPRGIGLPGRIWQSGRPEWISNVYRDRNFPRAELCREVGLQSGFGFPVQVAGRTAAVLEFFARGEVPADPDLLTIVRSVGQQMGRVLERKQAEAERARLAAIVQSSQDAIIGTTLDDVITSWNSGAQRIYGYTAEEVIGRSITMLMPDELGGTAAGRREQLSGGQAVEAFETLHLTKDHRRLDVLLTMSPVIDETGAVIGASLIARNITERKRTERTLAEQARLAQLRADVAAALATGEGLDPMLQQCCEVLVRELDVAFARIWVLNSEDVLELRASAGLYTHRDGAHSRIQLGQFKIGRIALNRQPHLTNDVLHDPHISNPEWARQEGMVAFAGYPLVIEQRAVGVMAMFARRRLEQEVLRDLQGIAHIVSQCIDRKHAEDSLRRVNRDLREKNDEMEQFVYTVSHDLKSPLVTINGFIGLLVDHLKAGRMEKVEHCLQRIRRSADRMSELIDHLLELSRIGRVPGTATSVDMDELLREIAANLQGQLEQAQATLQIGSNLPHIRADRARLVQVFENLVINAIKYGCPQPGGEIRIGGEVAGDEVRFHVRDQGPGIPPEFHEKIFGLFQRLDARRDGTGVGLAIVSKIIKVHGGTVRLESTPGQGATFQLIFPRVLLVPPSNS